MKKFITILTVLIILFAVSCNMDSSSGLFEDAGKSVKKESYTIKSVLSKIDDTNYIVSSNEGIFLLSGGLKASKAVGTGNIASYSILATGDRTDWKALYYSESDNAYYWLKSDGSREKFDKIDSGLYTLTSVYLENVNEDKYVIVFRTGSGKNAVFSGTKSELTSSPVITETDYTNVSYIGDNYFIGTEYNDTTKTNVVYLFTYDGTTLTKIGQNTTYRGHIKNLFVTVNDELLDNSGNTVKAKDSSSGNTYTMPNMYYKDNVYYFILDSLKEVYTVTANGSEYTFTSKSCTSLTNIEVIAICNVIDGKYINVITSESGTKCINLEDNSIDSSWK